MRPYIGNDFIAEPEFVISMRIVDIVHFDQNKRPSSTLNVDDVLPTTDAKGYVAKGSFYLSVKDAVGKKITIKLTDMEAIDLAKRIDACYQNHVYTEMQLQASRTRDQPERASGSAN